MKINLLLIMCPQTIIYFGPNKFNGSVGSTRMKPMKRIFTYIVETTSIALIVHAGTFGLRLGLGVELDIDYVLFVKVKYYS